MPDIEGMKVLRDVKTSKPSLPVFIITGYATVKSYENLILYLEGRYFS
ncbi:MAG: hypothetical protein HWN70_05655 [Desulfobacterales bacterium]|nr:hypothetical protein [Desulfobacterales bacterium]